MDSSSSRLFEFLLDDVNRMLVMMGVATAFGVGSVILFFYSPGNSPTRLHLLLLIAAAGILFYLALRSNPA